MPDPSHAAFWSALLAPWWGHVHTPMPPSPPCLHICGATHAWHAEDTPLIRIDQPAPAGQLATPLRAFHSLSQLGAPVWHARRTPQEADDAYAACMFCLYSSTDPDVNANLTIIVHQKPTSPHQPPSWRVEAFDFTRSHDTSLHQRLRLHHWWRSLGAAPS